MKRLCIVFILAILCVYTSGCGYQLGLVGKDTSVNKVYCYTLLKILPVYLERKCR